MRMEDMILVSVDDHLVEPANTFERHSPAKYRDRMPRIIKGPNGEDIWTFEGKKLPTFSVNAVVGRPYEEYGFEPTGFDQLRRGTYDVHARIEDMSANGVLASMNFGSFPGFAGQIFERATDKDLAHAALQAYNDWHIYDWCGAYPDRLIPLGVIPNWDPARAAAEIRRLKKLGCNAISFPPNPTQTGLPSLHSDFWDPIWKACSDEGVIVCMHITDPRAAVPAMDSPVDVWMANMQVTMYATASDLTFSPVLRKYPKIRFALSEGGVGWIPHFLERIDAVYKRHHFWTNQDFGDRKPSELFLEHCYTCFIEDDTGIGIRHRASLDNMTWECDYPHADTTWPDSPEILWKSIGNLPENEIDKITHLNAMRAFQFDPFKFRPKENCTVGALRAEAAHIDVRTVASKGGIPAARHKGVVTFQDLVSQLSDRMPVAANR